MHTPGRSSCRAGTGGAELELVLLGAFLEPRQTGGEPGPACDTRSPSCTRTCTLQVSKGAYRGEQLAYIAALTTGSLLVHGDRPKDVTYRYSAGCERVA